MKYSKEEIRKSMLLYAVTDRMWLKEGEKLTDVCKMCWSMGQHFCRSGRKTWMREPLSRKQRN